jgi:hypothetical protein
MKNLEKIDRIGRNPIPKYINREVTRKMQTVTKLFMQKKKELLQLPQDCTSKHLLKDLKSKELNLLRLHCT